MQGCFNIQKSINEVHCINRMKSESPHDHFNWCRKCVYKMWHPFMIKTLNKLERNDLYRIKVIWCSGKEAACQCRKHERHEFDPWVRKIPLEEETATHSSILAWKSPWTEEPGGLIVQAVTKSWTWLCTPTHMLIHEKSTENILFSDISQSHKDQYYIIP